MQALTLLPPLLPLLFVLTARNKRSKEEEEGERVGVIHTGKGREGGGGKLSIQKWTVAAQPPRAL